MEIYKAKVMGFCYGVRRAMNIAEKAAETHDNAVTFGPLIHNPQVVSRLEARGVPVVNDLNKLNNETVIILSLIHI